MRREAESSLRDTDEDEEGTVGFCVLLRQASTSRTTSGAKLKVRTVAVLTNKRKEGRGPEAVVERERALMKKKRAAIWMYFNVVNGGV